MSRPQLRKTKRAKKKIYTIDDARNLVIKIKEIENVSKNTLDNYEKFWNDMDRFFDEKMNVADLTIDDARDFIHWQLHVKTPFKKANRYNPKVKGVSVSSVNTYLSLGKGAFKVLQDERVTNNIFAGISKLKEDEKQIEVLTIDEIKHFFKSLDKSIFTEFRCYVCCHMMLDSFGRVDEILNVKKTDIDFKRKCVSFTQTKNRRVRTIPLTNKTLKLIEELIDETEEFDTEYLFTNVFGRRLTPDAFRKHLKECVERSGIKKRVHPHLFRHTASQLFLSQNGSLRVLQSILDHSDSATTARYAHLLDDTVKEQHEQFSPVNLLKLKAKTRTDL